nr:MAG TPA: hypothetical protein [Caudoviricetes sp.]
MYWAGNNCKFYISLTSLLIYAIMPAVSIIIFNI